MPRSAPTLRCPCTRAGGEYARVRQTKQTFRQRQDDLEAAFRAVRNEVTAAWQALLTASTQIESVSAQVRANQIAVEGARQEALVGQRTTLDVLDRNPICSTRRSGWCRRAAIEIVASYRVKASVGELTVVGINLPVQPYNPDAYYLDVRSRLIGLGESLNAMMMWRRIASRRAGSPERDELPGERDELPGGKDVTTEPREQQEPSMEEIFLDPPDHRRRRDRRQSAATTNSVPPEPRPKLWAPPPTRSPGPPRTKVMPTRTSWS